MKISYSASPPTSIGSISKEIIMERLRKIDDSKLEPNLKLGSIFKFRIIILEISGISSDYSDIFCQFNFMHRINEAYSTELMQNSSKGPSLGFFHIQNVIAFKHAKILFLNFKIFHSKFYIFEK